MCVELGHDPGTSSRRPRPTDVKAMSAVRVCVPTRAAPAATSVKRAVRPRMAPRRTTSRRCTRGERRRSGPPEWRNRPQCARESAP